MNGGRYDGRHRQEEEGEPLSTSTVVAQALS